MIKIKFLYRNLKISPKKLKNFLKKIKNLSINNFLIYLNFFNNKSSYILKKLIFNSINNIFYKLKFFNLFMIEKFFFVVGKGFYLKKLFYRSKGLCNIKKKYSSNLFLNFYINNGSKN